MMRRLSFIAVWILLALPAWSGAAESPSPKTPGVYDDVRVWMYADPTTLNPYYGRQWDVRFGYWGSWQSGSPTRTGEWQDWKSAPFWDVDGLTSDGRSTLNFAANGTDQETSKAKLQWYRGNASVSVDYDRFIHRLEHDTISNIPSATAANLATIQGTNNNTTADPYRVFKQDLAVGQDYAYRVQELNSKIKLMASDNLKVRLDLWGMEKSGVRQANSIAMCYDRNTSAANMPPDHLGLGAGLAGNFTGNRCHLLSQPQAVTFTTMEIKPVIEMRLGDSLVLEYSRPMRGFNSAEGFSSFSDMQGRYYNGTGLLTYNAGTNPAAYPYNISPSNTTQMDQLKISYDLSEDTKVYSYLMFGDTESKDNYGNTSAFPGLTIHRQFHNVDLRVTNKSIQNVTLTGFGKLYGDYQNATNVSKIATNSATAVTPTTAALSANNTAILTTRLNDTLDNYHKTSGGFNGAWKVHGGSFDRGGLSVMAGYEYIDLDRWLLDHNANVVDPATGATGFVLSQNRTITNCFQIGPDWRINQNVDAYVRYKFQAADQPLLGSQGQNSVINSILPTTDHLIEFGTTWLVSDRLMLNGMIGIEYAENHNVVPVTYWTSSTTSTTRLRPIAFDEQSFPFSINGWYGVTECFSVSAGFAETSNFIGQDIHTADQFSQFSSVNYAAPLTGRWAYQGKSDILNFGFQYRATPCLRYVGQLDYIWSHNLVSSAPFTSTLEPVGSATYQPALPSDNTLGYYSRVLNRTTKISVGADYQIRPQVITYVRYELYDFLDQAPGYDTGTAQGVLGGLTAMF